MRVKLKNGLFITIYFTLLNTNIYKNIVPVTIITVLYITVLSVFYKDDIAFLLSQLIISL